MKVEINLETKAKFFAQYWGQDILCSDMYGDGGTIYSATMRDSSIKNEWLELKSLSDISDEDAIELGYSTCNDQLNANYGMSPSGCFLDENGHMDEFLSSDVDFLRSRGYLVPWMGLSCEELIEAGWVIYKEV